MDWPTQLTYFYSTMAQSAAALVGLLGAFLVTRLIAHLEELSQLRIAIYYKISQTLNSNRNLGANLPGWITHAHMFGSNPPTREDFIQEEAVCKLIYSCWRKLQGEVTEEETKSYAGLLTARKNEVRATPRKNEIVTELDRVIGGLNDVRKAMANYKRKLLPRQYSLIFFLLILLTLSGILWPMIELSVMTYNDSLVGYAVTLRPTILLLAFSVSIISLCCYFGWQWWALSGHEPFIWGQVDAYTQEQFYESTIS